jgi:hypothetical protein
MVTEDLPAPIIQVKLCANESGQDRYSKRTRGMARSAKIPERPEYSGAVGWSITTPLSLLNHLNH